MTFPSPSQVWLEMKEIRQRRLDDSVWIPLRMSELISRSGSPGFVGYQEDFHSVVSMAVREPQRKAAERLAWMDFHLSGDHAPCVEDGEYVPCDLERREGVDGLRLVIEQPGNSLEPRHWHLHPDLVVGLGLKLEGDSWLAMKEGYAVAARRRISNEGPAALEVKSEFLKDYLAARGMALYVNSYRARTWIPEDGVQIQWPTSGVEEINGADRWSGRIGAIHEGGRPFGSTIAVVHLGRTDVDQGHDVPKLGINHRCQREHVHLQFGRHPEEAL